MTERWRRELAKLDRLGPDPDGLRHRVKEGPRLPEPAPSPGTRIVAGAVALVLGMAAVGLAAVAIGGSDSATPSALDPGGICSFTSHADPSYVGLLGRELPRDPLDDPGLPAAEVGGPAGDALRAYLESPAAGNAPPEGWRPLVDEPGEVVFGAPFEPGYWFVVGFTEEGNRWRLTTEMIDEEVPTAAQRGAGLHLEWTGPLEVADGAWQTTLALVNNRDEPWVDSTNEHWATAYVFGAETGEEVRAGERPIAGIGHAYRIQPGERVLLPVAIADPDVLPVGSYDVVACVDDLALASPIGRMEVSDDGGVTVPDVLVLTYSPGGDAMQALGGGVLAVRDSCLAVEHPEDSSHQFVIWPAGWSLRSEDGALVLVDAVGERVAAVGDRITFGGGNVELAPAEDFTLEPIPEACRLPGEGYFVMSGEVVEVVPGA